jgi:hypothetical protein
VFLFHTTLLGSALSRGFFFSRIYYSREGRTLTPRALGVEIEEIQTLKKKKKVW